MPKKAKVIFIIPICVALLLVLAGFTFVSATNKVTRSADNSLANSVQGASSLYIPYLANKVCSVQPVESPFSIEISKLYEQISPTNVIDRGYSEEQFNDWYNQAFPILLTSLKDSGAGWTRIVIRWKDIEPDEPIPGQQPVYDPIWLQRYDDRIRLISEAGLKIIAVINAPPPWANGDGTNLCPAVTTEHVAAYQQFLTDLVSRYSLPPYNIKTWEIFNEADNATEERAESHACFGDSTFGDFSSIYAQVLSASYSSIKGVNPSATVLLSGIAYENWNEPPYNGPFYRYFPDDIMELGAASSFDVLNFHYFPDFHLEWERWGPPENPPTCSRPPGEGGEAYDGSGIDVIAKKNFYTNRMSTCYNVVNKPVWVTELAEHGWVDDASGGALRNQAYYVVKAYSRALAADVKNITWFALANPPEDKFDQSLLFLDYTPKPAYTTYQTLVSQLTNYKYDRTLSSDSEAYVFKNSCGDEKIVAWGNNTLIDVTAKTLDVTNYLGSVDTINDGGAGDEDGTINGSIRIKLTTDPMTGSTRVSGPVPIPVFIHVTSR